MIPVIYAGVGAWTGSNTESKSGQTSESWQDSISGMWRKGVCESRTRSLFGNKLMSWSGYSDWSYGNELPWTASSFYSYADSGSLKAILEKL